MQDGERKGGERERKREERKKKRRKGKREWREGGGLVRDERGKVIKKREGRKSGGR